MTTKRARLLPGNKEFDVHEHESVLDAALRAGLTLGYSCSNGSCGECRAILVEGELKRCSHYDYVFSEAEKNQGYVLLCSFTAQTNIVVEAATAQGVEDLPIQQIRTTVSKIDRVDERTIILHLKTPRSQSLRFFAGQHVTLNLSNGIMRNKSVASCPCNARFLQFHIHNAPGDEFADYVFNKLRAFDAITIEGPWGVFTLDDNSTRPIILLAYETGFAPFQSILEHAIALKLSQPIHLYWLVDNPGRHYLDNYIRSWVDALDNFQYTTLVAHEKLEDEGLTQERRIAALTEAGHQIIKDHPNLSGHDIYMCGPDSLTHAAVQLLLDRGLQEGHLLIDAVKRL
ncbi:MAG TPA: 2Fe-2S iron-sulfur cluster binding domain-containing protein [Acidiferrobacteraceae bacterium]|nr:2Fe-2S iron-sulfur cluster binding domain-containing protein [Acidiferrobacteraceae bacterium]